MNELFQNRVLLACLIAWLTAQLFKVLPGFLRTKKFDFKRFLYGLGGMPSSHSATVSALCVSCGMARGFDSVEFAITLILALIVMSDASGIRRAAGKQAQKINQLMQEVFQNDGTINGDKLLELLGHSPFEVLIGALLGVLVAIIVM